MITRVSRPGRALSALVGGVVLGLVAVTAVGCGSDETGARTTVEPIQPTSYMVREPVTTTTVLATETNPDVDEEGRSTVEQEYVVQSGDAVALIASRYGIGPDVIAAYNDWPSGIQQPIYPGDVIRIPPGALLPEITELNATPTASTAPSTTLRGADGSCVEGTYVIVAGDIPVRVAQRFDISLTKLNEANANTPGYEMFIVGTEIVIPC
jgi:LysM repeat protein